jgi:hypothetical protein
MATQKNHNGSDPAPCFQAPVNVPSASCSEPIPKVGRQSDADPQRRTQDLGLDFVLQSMLVCGAKENVR